MTDLSLLLRSKIKGYYAFFDSLRIERTLVRIDNLKEGLREHARVLYKENYREILPCLLNKIDYQELHEMCSNKNGLHNCYEEYDPLQRIIIILTTIIPKFDGMCFPPPDGVLDLGGIIEFITFGYLEKQEEFLIVRNIKNIFGPRFRGFYKIQRNHRGYCTFFLNFGIQINSDYDSYIAEQMEHNLHPIEI